jgi:hypothetical protein
MAAGFPERLTATRGSPRFALLQKNVLDRRTWANRQELRIAIVTWIERTCHRRRRQRRLARLTPRRVRDHHDPSRGPGCINPC